jgi:hypothetical protein
LIVAPLSITARWKRHRHPSGIAAQARDVRAHPAQRVHDVEHAGVSRLRNIGPDQIAEIGKAEHVEAVVDRHHDDVAAQREMRAVGYR